MLLNTAFIFLKNERVLSTLQFLLVGKEIRLYQAPVFLGLQCTGSGFLHVPKHAEICISPALFLAPPCYFFRVLGILSLVVLCGGIGIFSLRRQSKSSFLLFGRIRVELMDEEETN